MFFGSARITPDGPLGRYYQEARELARLITTWSKSLRSHAHRYVICSGGGPGIMEAANRGASEAGGRTIGLNIGLPHEQRPNPYITRGLSFEFHYFFMRKLWFAHLARALVVFPGGFGTLDEMTEILTLKQTQKLDRPIPVLLYGSQYWKEIINFDALVRHGMISPEDLELFTFVDDPARRFGLLQKGLSAQPEENAAGLCALVHAPYPNAKRRSQQRYRCSVTVVRRFTRSGDVRTKTLVGRRYSKGRRIEKRKDTHGRRRGKASGPSLLRP